MTIRSPFSTGACSTGACALAALLALAAPARADGKLDPYLPKSGTIVGHVVTFAVAAEDQALSAQFRRAVETNMDWFKRAVTSNKPGAPLPYNTKMGVTEAEYDRLLHLQPAVKEGAAVSIAVKKAADGTVRLMPEDGGGTALSGIVFPPGEAAATTPVGSLTIVNDIHQLAGSGPLGAWNGAEWAQVATDDAGTPSAKLAFGKRDADGQGLLYYQVAGFKAPDGQEKAEQSLVVFYKLD